MINQNNIRINIKVSLPWYISIPAILFSLFLPFVFGCYTYEDVGINLDRAFSFLAILTFCNVFYIECQQKTVEIYYMISKKNKIIDICKRLTIRFIFLIAMVALCFVGYMLKGLHVYVSDVKEVLIVQIYFVILSGVLFFGGMSFMLVNVFKNLVAGIGVTSLLWLFLTSSIGLKLPAVLNVFAYGVRSDWMLGKIVEDILGVLFFAVGTIVINKNT